MIFRRLQTAGPDLEQEYRLRNEILRIPLRLVLHLTPEQVAAEENDFHYGLFAENGGLIACVIATPFAPGHYQIRQMAVIEGRQGDGLGRQLLQSAENELRREGATELMLHARDIAVGFYERLGYQPVGERFTEVCIEHQEMCKSLT